MNLDKNSLWKAGIHFLVLATIIFLNSRSIADADLWGHLRFGLDFLSTGVIAQVDRYSYLTVGQRWINHEWLAEAAFGLAWFLMGSSGLVILKTLFTTLTMGIVYLYLLKRQLSPIRAGSLTLLAWLLLFPATATIRPQLFTLLLLTLILLIIKQADEGKYHWLWAAPLVFALWVNLHGGFLAGLGFLGIWTLTHLVFQKDAWRRVIPPVVASFLTVLLNPYGLDLILFLMRTATIPRPEIIEWQPLYLISMWGVAYLIFLTICIPGLVLSRLNLSIPMVLLFGVASLLPFVAVRNLPFFALGGLILIGEHMGDSWSRFSPMIDPDWRRPVRMAVFSFLAGATILIWSVPNFQRIIISADPASRFPDRAVALLSQSQVSGNLAVEFDWGEYVIWYLGPEIKVSVDGRRETVYSEDIYKANFSFLYGINGWNSLITDYETDMALVKRSHAAYNLIKLTPGWELIYEDSVSALFASHSWDKFDSLKSTAARFIPAQVDGSFP